MERNKVIEDFTDQVNANLRKGITTDIDVYNAMKASLGDDGLELLEHLHECYETAVTPKNFVDIIVTTADENLEQTYELLRTTFDPSVLNPRTHYVKRYAQTHTSEKPRSSVLMCRSFRVSGSHDYDLDGNLIQYGFNPLQVTESAVCVINGSLMPISSQVYGGSFIAGIGYLATRPKYRKQGHGRDLTAQLEAELVKIAEAMGAPLRVIVLEAEGPARPFWSNVGYRWPHGSRYFQPPISFDANSGDPEFPEVPELLMVKMPMNTEKSTIETTLLQDTVKTIYERWYLSEGDTPEAAAKITEYVMGKMFGDFVLSIASHGKEVPLGIPVY